MSNILIIITISLAIFGIAVAVWSIIYNKNTYAESIIGTIINDWEVKDLFVKNLYIISYSDNEFSSTEFKNIFFQIAISIASSFKL